MAGRFLSNTTTENIPAVIDDGPEEEAPMHIEDKPVIALETLCLVVVLCVIYVGIVLLCLRYFNCNRKKEHSSAAGHTADGSSPISAVPAALAATPPVEEDPLAEAKVARLNYLRKNMIVRKWQKEAADAADTTFTATTNNLPLYMAEKQEKATMTDSHGDATAGAENTNSGSPPKSPKQPRIRLIRQITPRLRKSEHNNSSSNILSSSTSWINCSIMSEEEFSVRLSALDLEAAMKSYIPPSSPTTTTSPRNPENPDCALEPQPHEGATDASVEKEHTESVRLSSSLAANSNDSGDLSDVDKRHFSGPTKMGQSLSSKNIGDEEEGGRKYDDECQICLCHFKTGQDVCQSNGPACRHVFHQECMERWLMSHDLCPVCRELYVVRRKAQKKNQGTDNQQIIKE